YRQDINVESATRLYYMLNFAINENIKSEQEAQILEIEALQYHTRALATEKGLAELEKQLALNI
ncbi:MAG TPA: TetR/AcrR family transcriptional regulator, partial [Flavobacterium sp.]|nr:TetR/AcrR family transcriptional regulator [Flavobacterium sp.]